MIGTRYQVKAGDTLWSIAHEHLGHGAQWPRIWRYNNRRDVIRATGHGIPDPDLIHAGSTILIPVLPGQREHGSNGRHHTHHTSQHHNPSTSATTQASHSPSPQPLRTGNPATELKKELPHIYSPISIKYRLNDLTMPVIETPTATIEFRMTGDVVLMTDKRYPATYVSNGGRLETQISQQANVAFGQLIGDTRFIYDSKKKEVTVRSMLVSQSTTPNAAATAVGVEFSSSSPIPKLRAEVRFPKLQGRIGPFHYVAMSVAFVILITPKAHIPPSAPSPQAVRDAVRIREPEEGTNWSRVIGTGLVIGAGVIVVGTLVEDFFSGGVGVADDPASFAAAGASLTRGLAMLRGAATTALPRAMVPAAVHVGARVGLAH
jgi:hypothetical protein